MLGENYVFIFLKGNMHLFRSDKESALDTHILALCMCRVELRGSIASAVNVISGVGLPSPHLS